MTVYQYPDPAISSKFRRGLIERLLALYETRQVAAREARRADSGLLGWEDGAHRHKHFKYSLHPTHRVRLISREAICIKQRIE